MIRHLPNVLTLGRLVLTVIFVAMIFNAPIDVQHWSAKDKLLIDIAFIIFVIAGLTDIIDGKVARSLNVTSKLGRMLDPLVDKVLVCGTFIAFAMIGQPQLFGFDKLTLAVIHWTVFGILTAREAYVTIIRQWAESKGINFAATASGKLKMFIQTFAIGTVLVKMAHVPTATWASWFTTLVYAAMVISTVYSGIRATKRESFHQFVKKVTAV